MKSIFSKPLLLACLAAIGVAVPHGMAQTTLDDFNNNAGHFSSTITTSGSNRGMTNTSTATRMTTGGVEGAGFMRLRMGAINLGNVMLVRYLSGGGTIANNTPIITSDGTDGWIGFYMRSDPTNDPNWTVQFWLEGSAVGNNNSQPKTVINDGQWHLYEWNLDDFSGGADGWGGTGILSGSTTVTNGSHTIDSIMLRHASGPEFNTIDLDFVAHNPNGSLANLITLPCLSTPGVVVSGPVATNLAEVTVSGVVSNATAITVYQNTGPSGAMVQIGSKSTGIVAGDNKVPVSGMVKGATIVATETVNNVASCMPTTGPIAGGGANPTLRAALSIRQTGGTGPIGAPNPDTSSSLELHFLGTSQLTGGGPLNAPVIYPSNGWQTITFLRGTNVSVGDSANLDGKPLPGAGYNANEFVQAQVYAFKTLPASGARVYSTNMALFNNWATSNDVFRVEWKWDAVTGADGYRLVRSFNFAEFNEWYDVTNTTLIDTNGGWATNAIVEPKYSQWGPSVKYNASTGAAQPVGTTNSIPGDWGIFEAIAFSIDGDSGPYDVYIDALQNGDVVFQDFESATNGQTGVGFQAPSFSGSTSGALLLTPNFSVVSDAVAYDGTKSLHTSWQWNGVEQSKWLRFTTSGAGNPMVDLNQPISFRVLLLPVGTSVPSPNPGAISIKRDANNVILDWTGSYYLQESTVVTGGFTDVTGPISGPYTNAIGAQPKFYRLRK